MTFVDSVTEMSGSVTHGAVVFFPLGGIRTGVRSARPQAAASSELPEGPRAWTLALLLLSRGAPSVAPRLCRPAQGVRGDPGRPRSRRRWRGLGVRKKQELPPLQAHTRP